MNSSMDPWEEGSNQFFDVCFVFNDIHYTLERLFRKNIPNTHTHQLFNLHLAEHGRKSHPFQKLDE